MKSTFKNILAEYGAVAVVVYFTIFVVVLFGMWAAIHFGWQPQSATGNVGAFTAAYLATKLTQGFRIAATLALTPLVARLHARFTGKAVAEPVTPAAHPPVELS